MPDALYIGAWYMQTKPETSNKKDAAKRTEYKTALFLFEILWIKLNAKAKDAKDAKDVKVLAMTRSSGVEYCPFPLSR